MAVIYNGNGNRGGGLLGGLGGLMTLGGGLFGMPWMSAAGAGMTAANNVMNGGGAGSAATLGSVLNDIANGGNAGGWFNPASNNIANTDEQNAVAAWRRALEDQQIRGILRGGVF